MIPEIIPKGTIAIVHRGTVLTDLMVWVGQQKERWPGRIYTPGHLRGNNIARSRNGAVEQLWGDWLLFVDSDVLPQPDALARLLSREVEVVGAVCLEQPPSFGVAAFRLDTDPLAKWDLPGLVALKPTLVEVAGCGTGCLLIRRSVFDRFDPPWFRCGQLDPERLGEDIDFCFRARAAGIRIHVDPCVFAGHRISGLVWPGVDGRRYIEWPGERWDVASESYAGRTAL